MELIVILLAAMSGALIGSSTGIFLMYRKLRPLNAADLNALRSKVRTTEFDLNAAIANGAKLKKEVAEQASKVSDEVVEKQRQLEAALAAKDLEAAHRNAAEQRIAELIAEADAGKARHAEIEAKAKELEAKAKELEGKTAEGPSPASEDQQRQLAAFQAQVETGGRQIQELTEQATRLAAEAAELKQHSEEAEKARTAPADERAGAVARPHGAGLGIAERTVAAGRTDAGRTGERGEGNGTAGDGAAEPLARDPSGGERFCCAITSSSI